MHFTFLTRHTILVQGYLIMLSNLPLHPCLHYISCLLINLIIFIFVCDLAFSCAPYLVLREKYTQPSSVLVEQHSRPRLLIGKSVSLGLKGNGGNLGLN